MQSLQEELDSLKPYFISIRVVDGIYVLDIILKDKWVMLESEVIKPIRDKKTINYYLIYSENATIDDLILFAKQVINYNLEQEEKQALLKAKYEEIKNLFNEKSLDELKRVRFEIDEEQPVKILPSPTIVNTNNIKIGENEIELTDEEREFLEEEKRAENFRKYQEINKISKPKLETIQTNPIPEKMEIESNQSDCLCGSDEACEKCIDKKY